METKDAALQLDALAQETRLDVFRLLVKAGPAGLNPGEIAGALGLPAPTLSFHLSQLKHAGLVAVTREGRSLRYAPDFDAMRRLMDFLIEDCCAGACRPADAEGDCA